MEAIVKGRWFILVLLGSAALANAQEASKPASTGGAAGAAQSGPAWIARSNEYANLLFDIEKKYSPESASGQGLSKYDELISEPTLEVQKAADAETKVVLAKLKQQVAVEKDKYVKQDLAIMIQSTELDQRRQDYLEDHVVFNNNASAFVYGGLQVLLDDQVAPERRKAAVVRLRKYAGIQQGYKPVTELLKQRVLEQVAKPGVIYPYKLSIETGLSRNALYVDGIAALFKKYELTGWEEPYAKLKKQLTAYDDWVRSDILPKARTDFRQPPELYALGLENYGIDIPPAQLAGMAHKAFDEYQAEMQTVAAQIAKNRGWSNSDYREVIRKLKEEQLVGDSILPFYEKRLGEIEKIIAV